MNRDFPDTRWAAPRTAAKRQEGLRAEQLLTVAHSAGTDEREIMDLPPTDGGARSPDKQAAGPACQVSHAALPESPA